MGAGGSSSWSLNDVHGSPNCSSHLCPEAYRFSSYISCGPSMENFLNPRARTVLYPVARTENGTVRNTGMHGAAISPHAGRAAMDRLVYYIIVNMQGSNCRHYHTCRLWCTLGACDQSDDNDAGYVSRSRYPLSSTLLLPMYGPVLRNRLYSDDS